MNRDKQIEKMADDVRRIRESYFGKADYLFAMKLYEDGYRKQIEGIWEKRKFIIFDSEKIGYRCSECKTTWDVPTNFCPYCGAKMKKT